MSELPHIDVLDLVLDTDRFERSNAGNDSAHYRLDSNGALWWREAMIGTKLVAGSYYQNLGVDVGAREVFSLVPAARGLEGKVQIQPVELFESIIALMDTAGSATLICEQDCEQKDIPRLKWGSAEAELQLYELSRYLVDGGNCPTFIIEK